MARATDSTLGWRSGALRISILTVKKQTCRQRRNTAKMLSQALKKSDMSTPWGCAGQVLRFSQPLRKQTYLIASGFEKLMAQFWGLRKCLSSCEV